MARTATEQPAGTGKLQVPIIPNMRRSSVDVSNEAQLEKELREKEGALRKSELEREELLQTLAAALELKENELRWKDTKCRMELQELEEKQQRHLQEQEETLKIRVTEQLEASLDMQKQIAEQAVRASLDAAARREPQSAFSATPVMSKEAWQASQEAERGQGLDQQPGPHEVRPARTPWSETRPDLSRYQPKVRQSPEQKAEEDWINQPNFEAWSDRGHGVWSDGGGGRGPENFAMHTPQGNPPQSAPTRYWSQEDGSASI